jgi:uncharacterized protein DUF3293
VSVSLKIHGAKLVIVSVMQSTPDAQDRDWPLYPETILSFAVSPRIEIDLRQTLSIDTLDKLRKSGFSEPFAILTAYDPRGQDLSAKQNEERKRVLDRKLAAEGYRFVHVDCCSPDRSHCEASVAVTMPREAAIELAIELEQVAIFWFDGERFWILGAIVETDPMMLPRSS